MVFSLFYGCPIGQGNRQSNIVIHCYLEKRCIFYVVNVNDSAIGNGAYLRENIALVIEIVDLAHHRDNAVAGQIYFDLRMVLFCADDLIALSIDGLSFASKLQSGDYHAVFTPYHLHYLSEFGYLNGLIKKVKVIGGYAFFFHELSVVKGGRAHDYGFDYSLMQQHFYDLKSVKFSVYHVHKKGIVHLGGLHEGIYVSVGINIDPLTGFFENSVRLSSEQALGLLSVGYIVITYS